MKRIAIIDDIRSYAEEIKNKILSSNWDCNIEVDIYDNPRIFLQTAKSGKEYNLCLSDIEMPDMDGIKLAKEIREFDPYMLLIFLTAYPKYAILGYKVDAYDFILKDQFNEEWEKVQIKIKKEFEREDDDYYLVQASNFFEKISLGQVFYIFKEKKYSIFVLERREIAVRKPLKQIQSELKKKNQFILVERGCIVNIEKIKRFELREIEMADGKKISLGHIRTSEVREKILSYYKGRF